MDKASHPNPSYYRIGQVSAATGVSKDTIHFTTRLVC